MVRPLTTIVKATAAALAGAVPATATQADVLAALAAPVASVTESGPLRFGDAPDRPNLVGTVRLKDGGAARFVYDTGIRPYTRSYAQAQKGPLRYAHGSKAPASIALSVDEHHELLTRTPGQALDAMARAAGKDGVSFQAMATHADFHDPQRPAWWGLCAQWSFTSLNRAINAKVDVDGPEGMRGLWLHGEWISRADLGNWAMAVAKKFVDLAVMSTESQTIGAPTARDLLTMVGALRAGGPGVVVDVFNDAHHGRAETWNQPLVKAEVVTESLAPDVVERLLERARADGWRSATDARLITITGTYGIEVADDYEGPAATKSSTWRVAVVTGDDDVALWGWMVDDPKVKDAGLPTTTTDPPPDYVARISQGLADAALAGEVGGAFAIHPYGREMAFFMGTVLQDGVSGRARAAFEADVVATRGADVARLLREHPGVGRAYSAAQWAKTLAPLGLDHAAFSAPAP